MRKLLAGAIAGALTVLMVSSPVFAGQWKLDNAGWWYQEDNGSYPASAWKEIDGAWYYFLDNGYMAADRYIGEYYVGKDGAWVQGAAAEAVPAGLGEKERKNLEFFVEAIVAGLSGECTSPKVSYTPAAADTEQMSSVLYFLAVNPGWNLMEGEQKVFVKKDVAQYLGESLDLPAGKAEEVFNYRKAWDTSGSDVAFVISPGDWGEWYPVTNVTEVIGLGNGKYQINAKVVMVDAAENKEAGAYDIVMTARANSASHFGGITVESVSGTYRSY